MPKICFSSPWMWRNFSKLMKTFKNFVWIRKYSISKWIRPISEQLSGTMWNSSPPNHTCHWRNTTTTIRDLEKCLRFGSWYMVCDGGRKRRKRKKDAAGGSIGNGWFWWRNCVDDVYFVHAPLSCSTKRGYIINYPYCTLVTIYLSFSNAHFF